MKLVIDIPEEEYEEIIFSEDCGLHTLTRAIARGIPLPKGHGRLIDESDLMPDSDYEDGIFYAVSIGAINGASTIIEADKEHEVEIVTRGNCMMCGKELDEGLFFCKECEAKAESEKEK